MAKQMTWKDLKEFANSLPAEELGKTVTAWTELRGIEISNAERVKDTRYMGLEEGDGSFWKEDEWDGLTEQEQDRQRRLFEYERYEKGTPILRGY